MEASGEELVSPDASIKGFLRFFVPYFRLYGLKAVLVVLGLLLETGFNAALPLSLKYLIDNALLGHNRQALRLILALLGGGVVLVSLAGLGRDTLYAGVSAGIVSDLRRRTFEHLQRLSMSFYARTQAGDILSRFSGDLAVVENLLATALPLGVLPALDALSCTVVLFLLDYRLALGAMLIWPLCLAGPSFFAPRAVSSSYQKKQLESAVLSAVQENVLAQPVVKAFGLVQRSLAHFGAHDANLAKSAVRVNFLSAMVERSAVIAILILNVVIIGVGASMAFAGSISIGTLVTFQTAFLNLSYSLSYVTQYVPSLVQAAGGIHQIQRLLDQQPQIVDASGALPLSRLEPEIAYRNVTFSYTGEQLNLCDVSFQIPYGSFVAFVGPSGSGKSTVLNLLTRFYDPTEGSVTLDGHDLRAVTQESLRAQMAVVFQENFLFNTKIRENIRMGDPDATDEAVEAAARAAEIHDVITALPQGYETIAGERGGRFSGGQRQRVGIARAILRDPSILILDEATSALDPGTEAAINATIARLARGRTVIAVTHRLAGIRDADRIFVLDRGHVAEAGTHAELLVLRGIYHQLWQKQSGFTVSEEGDRAAVDVERLGRFPLMDKLDRELLEEAARLLTTEPFPANRTVIYEGDAGDRFYIVVRGKLAVSQGHAASQVRQIAVLQDGDHFGEIALLKNVPRTTTVRTLEPSLLLSLTRDRFLQLLAKAPHLRELLEQEIAAYPDMAAGVPSPGSLAHRA